ncbi:Secreted frizzled-related protein 5 [Liparis tanakae]|uniref:Secreted frizzled-related protein 5 n=1 Tax=Liparis tanakae TaxID=230148 RepID=A0A4Z2ID67_9TELE|nr:Secreted frizzled-related protein 5 [Liparis tanakae]
MAVLLTAALLTMAFDTSHTAAFDMSQSTRCVTIPQQMRVCKDVGYSEMRLPNFLGHSNLEAEVVPRSEEWRPLLQTGCHPEAQAFLCSIIAPVCLDTFIQPCRSLCVAVRDSCAPVLACQGHSWPEALDCDRFPAEQDICLSHHTKFNHFTKAVTARFHRRRLPTGEPEYGIEGRVEFIRQGPLLPYDTRHLLRQWLLINLRCAADLVRPGRSQLYVLTGSVQPDGTLALTLLFPWQKKDASIAAAIRKWKHHRC